MTPEPLFVLPSTTSHKHEPLDATLEIYRRDKIFETAAGRMPQFQKRLMALGDHPLVGEARGMGMVGGLELSADRRSKTPFFPMSSMVWSRLLERPQKTRALR